MRQLTRETAHASVTFPGGGNVRVFQAEATFARESVDFSFDRPSLRGNRDFCLSTQSNFIPGSLRQLGGKRRDPGNEVAHNLPFSLWNGNHSITLIETMFFKPAGMSNPNQTMLSLKTPGHSSWFSQSPGNEVASLLNRLLSQRRQLSLSKKDGINNIYNFT